MIDTHSHIFLPEFDEDRNEMMAHAHEAGVTDIFMPAIDFTSLPEMEKLPSDVIRLHKMAGIHPCDVDKAPANLEEILFEHCKDEKVLGVGETGLDYYWSTEFVNEQKESLKAHLRVAKAVKKPIVLHNRNSTGDLLDLVEEAQDGTLSGIWHCFNGTVDEGKRALDLGLHLGIGGVITFKNAGVDKTVAQLPPEKMVLETDAPYLAPVPHRGKRNEPAFIKFTAAKLSEIFGLDLQELDRMTTQTAKHLFSIS